MSDKDRIRAWKKEPRIIVIPDEEYEGHISEYNSCPSWTPVHCPNKNESKKIRSLMSETGLTEEQLRKHKKYRIQLSQAQKNQGTKTSLDRLILRMRKRVTRQLQLPKEHPLVKEAFYKELDSRSRYFLGFDRFSISNINWEYIVNLK